MWSSNLCRLCAKISDICHPIYNNDPTSNPIEEKIKKCLHLVLFKDDYKPKQICNSCLIKLNDFSDFLDTTYTTNEKFESMYTNWSERTNYDCLQQQKQSVIVTNKQAINEDLALDNLNVDCQLNEDEVLDFVGCNSDFTCIQYVNQTNYQHETVLRHPNDATNYPETNLNRNRAIVSVDAVRNSIQLPVHVENRKKKTNLVYPCPHCDRKFMRRGNLNAHIAIHTNIRPYRCQECPKTFPVKSELTTHRKAHSDIYKCKFCMKKFTVPSKLKRHLRIHTNERPFSCTICGRAFSDKRNLAGHQATHTADCNFECNKCKKKFKTLHRLKQHLKCHQMNVCMFKCDLCAKCYKYKNNLVNHMKKHGHFCTNCKQNFNCKRLLDEHFVECEKEH